uniref:Hypoxia-inducible factor 1-alpha n=1 Tax=Clastoptera arizonana TaxID=38151 RepID=A0A1B6D4M5_9HEMI
MEEKKPPTKEKKRNSERRKEKSRDAARCRRSRETEIFTDLAHALPLPPSAISQLDKASIMRLAISYLRVRTILNAMPNKFVSKAKNENDALLLRALEGFLLIVSADGDIIFLSENVNEYLGLSQIELMGQSIYEVSHPCDHNEVKEILTCKDVTESSPRTFFIRMKCTLTSKGRNVNLKSATYKVIQCTGHIVNSEPDSNNNDNEMEETTSQICLVAIGEPIPHPANIEIPLGKQTFLSKHSLDMKFTYADEKMAEFLGYDPEALIGKSVYEFHHAQDSVLVNKAFKSLFSKGQTQTGRYRFLAHGGGYVWVLSQGTLIYNMKGHKPQSVVCVHFIISGLEHKEEIYSCSQLENGQSTPVKQVSENLKKETELTLSKPFINAAKLITSLPKYSKLSPAPYVSTETKSLPLFPPKVFVPRLLTDQVEVNANSNIIDSQSIIQNHQVTTHKVFPKIVSESKPSTSNKPQIVTDRIFSKPQTSTEKLFSPSGFQSTSNYCTPLPKTESNTKLKLIPEKLFASIVKPEPSVSVSQETRPQPATSKIFAPRTKEMIKGFLTYSDDESGLTMMKDEPEDLTHLAPTAGDTCVPLSNPLFGDVLDHFMLSDNYCPLLSEAPKGMNSPSSPFFPYRDELSSSGSLSPALTQSPGGCSIPSLCSLGEDSPPLEDTAMSTLLGLDLVDPPDSDDLNVKAPYIPMSGGDDLPLLMPTDLMWGAGPSPTANYSGGGWSPPPPLIPESKPDLDSNLAKLLRAESKHNFTNQNSSSHFRHTFVNKKGDGERRKRSGTDSSGRANAKRSKHSPSIPRSGVLDGGGKPSGSVLMNLLVSGCDVSAGYICLNARKPYARSYKPYS